MEKQKEVNKIISNARKSIGKFCIEECNAYCCRKGYILINERQLNLLVEEKEQIELKKENKLKELSFSGKFMLDFSNYLGGCPKLKGTKCSIHSSLERPKVCQEFPIFLLGNNLRISSKCPAHQKNMFFPFIKQLEGLGCELTED
ncbi:YkgJ family cysteine cluster protein [Candidatus Pacearchaeota archaeon]|nr:MAG: hypothetical protein QJ16_C0018G0002 [archaeon GW2011_AR1]MBS3078335.1 YkgJ family cysteine cluster protein [Candidatus Pacearchaeota archaeon]HIH52177.1 hypothetical protein [Nanoarchaeota archaeon]